MWKGSSSSGSPIPVTVIWDFENAWIPDGYRIENLKSNIETALRRENLNFFIEEMIAVGPGSNGHNKATTIGNHMKVLPIPKENIPCLARNKANDCQDLVVRGTNINGPRRIIRTTDVADMYAVKELFMKVLQKKKYILMITGDIDFRTAMDGLFRYGDVHVMLAKLENSSRELDRVSKKTWLWKSENPENERTMVKGGAPL